MKKNNEQMMKTLRSALESITIEAGDKLMLEITEFVVP